MESYLVFILERIWDLYMYDLIVLMMVILGAYFFETH